MSRHAKDNFLLQSEIAKVDSELGLVFGWGIICKDGGEEYFDLQRDSATERGMLEAALEFMEDRRVAKEMHEGEQRGTIVFAWPMTTEIAKAFGFDTGNRTGFLIAMKPDRELFEKFKSGEARGFSIGGTCDNRSAEFLEAADA